MVFASSVLFDKHMVLAKLSVLKTQYLCELYVSFKLNFFYMTFIQHSWLTRCPLIAIEEIGIVTEP